MKPIFIVGMPRSGTTLISNMLNVLNEVHFPEETHFFSRLQKYNSRSIFFRSVVSFGDFYFSKRMIYNRNEIIDKGLINKFDSLETISEKFKFILHLKGGNLFKDGIVYEKTPDHMNCIELIRREFPNAKFVLLVRDPRDVFNSLRTVNWNKVFPLKDRIYSYRKLSKLSVLDYVHTIKYEDLITEPVIELEKACKFLSLNYKESMSKDFFNKENSNFDLKSEPWKINNTKRLNPNNKFKWKQNKGSFNDYISLKLFNDIKYFNYEIDSKLSIYYIYYEVKGELISLLRKIKNSDLFFRIIKNY